MRDFPEKNIPFHFPPSSLPHYANRTEFYENNSTIDPERISEKITNMERSVHKTEFDDGLRFRGLNHLKMNSKFSLREIKVRDNDNFNENVTKTPTIKVIPYTSSRTDLLDNQSV